MSTKYAGQVALNKLMQLVKNAIPTKVSQLTNDAGFITDADIPEGAAASTTAPLMDGTAAVGVSNAFARGDHVHPSDDSKLSLSGGTMTGELNMGNKNIRNVATLIAKYIYLGEDAGDVGVPILNHVQFAPTSSSDGKQSLVLTGGYSSAVNVKGINTPVDDTDAANKAYVDNMCQEVSMDFQNTVKKTGDTMTGNLDMGEKDIIDANEVSTNTLYLRPLASYPDGGVSVTAEKTIRDEESQEVVAQVVTFYGSYGDEPALLRNVYDPENNLDAANKAYVDGKVAGLQTAAQVQSAIASAISGVYTPKGTVAFASLPTASAANLGWVYNISDAFTTTASFVEGAGYSYGAGTNVVCVDAGSGAYKWDVLAGTIDLTELTEAEVQTIWDSV